MTISVTQDHIDAGERCSCCDCPAALAIHCATNQKVWVREKSIRIGDEIRRHTIPTPPEVRAFIDAFDDGKPVQPFTFELACDTEALFNHAPIN